MGRLGPVGGAAGTGRGSAGGCAAVVWRSLIHGKFSKWGFRSGREAYEGWRQGLGFASSQGGTGHRATSGWPLCRKEAQTALVEGWDGVQLARERQG